MSKQTNSLEIGGGPLILNKNNKKQIKRRSVIVYPYLVLDRFMNYDEMFSWANILSTNLEKNNLNCDVLDKNTYTYELNGNWNVVLSIKYIYNHTNYYAMFAIINCIHNKKTHICPFYSIEYIFLNHYPINYFQSNEEFKILENEIKKLEQSVIAIDSF